MKFSNAQKVLNLMPIIIIYKKIWKSKVTLLKTTKVLYLQMFTAHSVYDFTKSWKPFRENSLDIVPLAHSLHICKKVSFLLLYVALRICVRPMNLALNFESRKEKKSIVRLLFRKIGRANLWGENMRLIIWIYGYLLCTQALLRKVDWIIQESNCFFLEARNANVCTKTLKLE